jgi:putative redox protein
MENTKEPVSTIQAQIDRSHYRTVITTNKHSLITDEPLAAGGTDTAPSPLDLLLSSLGGCTAITLRMYIDRKMWVVDDITVNVELFEIDGAKLIELQLSFEGELSDEQRQRLVQIANACPIHKMLSGKTVIQTILK